MKKRPSSIQAWLERNGLRPVRIIEGRKRATLYVAPDPENQNKSIPIQRDPQSKQIDGQRHLPLP